MEITIKINEKTKAGKTFKSLLELFVQEHKGVEIVENKSPYKPEFVEMVKKAAKSKNRTTINPENVWESL